MNIGGVERSFLTLSNELLEKGNKVFVVTLNQNNNLLNYDNKIEIISLNTSRSILSLFKLSRLLRRKKTRYFNFSSILCKYNCDIVLNAFKAYS